MINSIKKIKAVANPKWLRIAQELGREWGCPGKEKHHLFPILVKH
jgi:hypothetical protein